jgi:hypothetical protein
MNEYPADHEPETDANRATAEGRASGASLTPLAQQYLDQTRPWVRFMSVATFAGAGLTMVMGLVMLAISMFGAAAGSSEAPGALASAVGGGLLALFYMALAVVYLAPGLYLSRYASAIKRLNARPSADGLEDTLKHQKSFWRFVGIATAIGLCIGMVVLALAVVAGILGAIMAGRT